MALSNGASNARDFQPPPSSMLATHVVNSRGPPRLNAHDFAELLQESLSTNEKGESNIGTDAEVNRKLLNVVLSIGVQPLIEPQTDDPFRRRIDQGRNANQLKDCLDVLNLTLQRTPEIVFQHAGSNTHETENARPIHIVLLAAAVKLVLQSQKVDLSKKCADILQACLNADKNCACGSCGTIVDCYREIIADDKVEAEHDFPDSPRLRKRPRLSTDQQDNAESDTDLVASIAFVVTRQLTGHSVADFDSVAANCSSNFRRLSELKQAEAVQLLGTSACQLARDSRSTTCHFCDTRLPQPHHGAHSTEVEKIIDTLEALQPHLERGNTTRLAALEAYRRVLNHLASSPRLDLTRSVAGRFGLNMLRSSSRDARIKAVNLLQVFLRELPNDAEAITRSNRVAMLEYLQTLWQSGRLVAQEGVVLALFRLATFVGDEELNIVLLRLIEYLGHPNAYIAGLIAAEFVQLAQALQTSMQGLLRPFWRTISVVIVKHITSRPAVAQQVCELLGMNITGLLPIMEEDAVPYLVVTGQVDALQKIASSNNSPMNAFELCVQPNILPKVLAALLAQGYAEPQDKILEMLEKVSEDFGEQKLATWLGINHSKIACELLKLAGDEGHGKSIKALPGLQLLAQLAYRKSPGANAGRRSDWIPSFLETNAWEIVTIFTSVFADSVTREKNVERRRCLMALCEVATLAKGRVSFVIPSICACLRSAMNDDALRDAAYLAWSHMALGLEKEEIGDLLDQTFSITIKHWPDLKSNTRRVGQSVIIHLITKQRAYVQEWIDLLPSLKSIPALATAEKELQGMRQPKDEMSQLQSFIPRLKHETMVVAECAMAELVEVLRAKSDFVQRSLMREQPDPVFAELIRAILDCQVRFEHDREVVLYASQCLGAMGRVDTSRVELAREKLTLTVVTNFAIAAETTDFLMFFMERVVVKEYLSASSLRSKNFLGWALQELLLLCEITPEIAARTRVQGASGRDRQWLNLAEETRLILTPFLTSKFLAPGKRVTEPPEYPIFKPNLPFETWLTALTLDLLTKGPAQNVNFVFDVCWKIVHFSRGVAIASFLLPYAALNLLLNGTAKEIKDFQGEVLCILGQPYHDMDSTNQETVRQCSQSVFDILDYMSTWLQSKRKWFAGAQSRAERGLRDILLDTAVPHIEAVDSLLRSVPPDMITQRSIECRSYARALLHWEEHIHATKDPSDDDYRRLQDIYAQIDEPDGIDGISSCMRVLNVESQILEHRKAGRWQAAQNWYEMQMTESPNDGDVRVNLLHALKESGQYDVLLHHFNGIREKDALIESRLLPFAAEAAWATAQFDTLRHLVDLGKNDDFNLHLGSKLAALSSSSDRTVDGALWFNSTKGLSLNTTSTIAASSDMILRAHVVEDLRLMTCATPETKTKVIEALDRRLDILGTDLNAKHYVLNVHRAIMHLRKDVFDNNDMASSWLTTAKLARKARLPNQAFDAAMRASSLGSQSVIIEQSKLMWLEGRPRKAIKTLEKAIESGAFNASTYLANRDPTLSRSETQEQNDMTAKAHVLLGKWLDQAGQTQSDVIIKTFRKSTEQNRTWERGWYHLGRHYNKILESERQKPPGKESQQFLTGEAARVVIDNFLRALACGNKYLFQTLPKMLTLWLELVSRPELEHDARRGNVKFHEHLAAQRKRIITEVNAYVKKYVERFQPVALYTILPQLVARITYQNQAIHEILQNMIAKVVYSFPQQALWTLMAVTKSIDKTRAQRGLQVINKVVDIQKKVTKNASSTELRAMISNAQRFTDELLRVADYQIEGKVSKISLARDLGFNHKVAPSKLVVPAESCLIPNIPTTMDPANMKAFRAFPNEPVTISSFVDDALVLSSLQKPRKMIVRGSDGHSYAILAKPKDDLRKDQRLMEFDTMINRFLKRDIDAAKRRLYIRTYAVIPLNEECGVIEWVNSLKTMRDVLLKLYRERNVAIDYGKLRTTLDDICATSTDKAKDFTDRVLPFFMPVLRYWFVETFPDPSTWLNARIRYTRSAAVMSIVGHILGLGDRHGENILFEEDNGGVMHVDFNCLFDKGLTFDKPECVPFRLTHNMIDAFGTFGVEGPFRRSCEVTMQLLRNNEDGLMTILETFLHDPTTDFQTAGKRRKGRDPDGLVPDTAEKMLEGVKGKLRGMLVGESVPLSVGGYVEATIKQAADRENLARMYIGWCAFL
ncbi:serine/threonine-protein kinase M1 [Lithohypha guttulata]|uniref:non-specific serine/threonine protein kinase n=1 Tax=Lithohypha guttulata TaxID=1690604 RepID=A0AAN7YID4_9EURO|nr:serine/threonine-protein kinase M1 [Lithohypha guttulata]